MKGLNEKHYFIVITYTLFIVAIFFIDSFQNFFCKIADPILEKLSEPLITVFNLPFYYSGCYSELSSYSPAVKITILVLSPILLLWIMSWKIKKQEK